MRDERTWERSVKARAKRKGRGDQLRVFIKARKVMMEGRRD